MPDNPRTLFGGTAITRAKPTGAGIVLQFESLHNGRHQLYAGRRFLQELAPGLREFRATFEPSGRAHFWVIAVSEIDSGSDLGEQLPHRPFNSFRLRFELENWPADARRIDVNVGAEPAAAPSVSLIEIPYRGNGAYQRDTRPMPTTGLWKMELIGRDNKLTGGNAGAPEPLERFVWAHPRDLVADAQGRRYTTTAENGSITITL